MASTSTPCRDPAYDLFAFNDDTNVATCKQENCSAKLMKRAAALKRHLQEFHLNVYESLAGSKSWILDFGEDDALETWLDEQPLSLFNLPPKEKEPKKTGNSVYNLFTCNDDSNIVTCKQENCSAKLGKKATTLKRHLQRFHKQFYEDHFCTDAKKGISDHCDDIAMGGESFSLYTASSVEKNPKQCRDPVYDLFACDDNSNIVTCKQDGCFAKLGKKATTLKRHLQRLHKQVYEDFISTHSKVGIADHGDNIAIDGEPFSISTSQTVKKNPEKCWDPVYELFTCSDDQSVATCKQENCSAKLTMKATTLKRHLQRSHKDVYEDLFSATSKSGISDNSADVEEEAFRLFTLPTVKTRLKQCRDPVYNLFTCDDDPNFATCIQENCSAKLSRKANTLKRHLQRFHKNVYEFLTESKSGILDPLAEVTVEEQPFNLFDLSLMGTNHRDPVYDLFAFIDDPDVAICVQENCSAKLARKATTLKRHLQRFHKNVYEALAESRSAVLDLCADIAMGGQPFSTFDSPSMKQICSFAALGAKEQKQTFSSEKVRQVIVNRAKEMRKRITAQLENQIFSVSVDFATLSGIEFFAVVVQWESQGKIYKYNLGCRHVLESHTAVNIKRCLKEILSEYKIDESSVLAFTCDSAANIQKAAKNFLKELQNNQFAVGCKEFQDEAYEEKQENDYYGAAFEYAPGCESDESHSDQDCDKPNDLAGSLAEEIIPTSYRVACVSHQLQLAITKWFQVSPVRSTLATARAISTLLRTQMVSRDLHKQGFPYAVLDQDTRWSWSSRFRMLKKLLLLKDFCTIHLKDELEKCEQSETFWEDLQKIKTILEPLAALTSNLQHEQLTIPKFNEFWIEARLELESFVGSNFFDSVQRLLELFNERRGEIDSNPLVIAGIYLDPRMRKSLTTWQQSLAKELIEAVFKSFYEGKLSQDVASTSVEETRTKFGKYVDSLSSQQACPTEKSLESVFQKYELNHFGQQVSHATDPTFFWLEQVDKSNPTHSYFASTALKIITCPLTEVTSERLFSLLSFVKNRLQESLHDDLIEDILFCKWNAALTSELL